MKKLLPALLTALCLTACGKHDDPQPAADPAPQVTMTRTMSYPTASRRDNGLTYTQKSMSIGGQLATDALELNFDVPEGNDNLGFQVPRTTLASKLEGRYPVYSQTERSATTRASYSYYLINTHDASSTVIFSAGSVTRGQLIITAYDAARQLLSGSFEVSLDDVADPTEHGPESSDTPRCAVRLTGTFTNLKLQP